ncbi:MAG TPA: peptide deformylase [Solirubrobacteraceae bacterium]|nr:peptide deformylase [Solirubrobacteraceae bacterium]
MPDDWIRQLGDPVLRLAARPVSQIDEVLGAQLRRMARTLEEADGAGLAATQVGILRRAFVYRLTPAHPVLALIEPTILASSNERVEFLEGCLSYNAVAVRVRRPLAVRVGARDLDGRELTIEAEGIEASLLQHEIDHLDGILTLDRAEPAERRRALAALLEAERARTLSVAA